MKQPRQRPYAAQGSSPRPQPAPAVKKPTKAVDDGDWADRHDKLSRG